MLETNVQGILRFVAVEREGLGVEGARRRWVETISCTQGRVLNAGAIGKVGGRQQAYGLLPVAGKGLLREVIDVNRREALKFRPFGVIGCVVVVDPGQNV